MTNRKLKLLLRQQAQREPIPKWEAIVQKLPAQAASKNPAFCPSPRRLRPILLPLSTLSAALLLIAGLVLFRFPQSVPTVPMQEEPGAFAEASALVSEAPVDSSPVQYAALRFPASPDTLRPHNGNQLSPFLDLAAFQESETLCHMDLLCKATVLNSYLKEYHYRFYDDKFEENGQLQGHRTAMVYQLRIDAVYFSKAPLQAGDTMSIEVDCFDGCVETDDVPYPLLQNRQYILPLSDHGEQIHLTGPLASGEIQRDSRYGLSYAFMPQIEITLNNEYIFPAGWESLITPETVDVISDDVEESTLSWQQLKLRRDTHFEQDIMALALQNRGICSTHPFDS